MVSPPKKPAVALSKVPSVKELCDALSFQRASTRDTTDFLNIAHAWRKSYVVERGRPGRDLVEWKKPEVQSDLAEMATKFLDCGNGLRFWTKRCSWSQDGDLEYPSDKARIVELLKQLFWKQNRYAANNAKHAVDREDGVTEDSDETWTPLFKSKSTRPSSVLKLRYRGRAQHDEVNTDASSSHPTNVEDPKSVISISDDEPSHNSSPTQQNKTSAPPVEFTRAIPGAGNSVFEFRDESDKHFPSLPISTTRLPKLYPSSNTLPAATIHEEKRSAREHEYKRRKLQHNKTAKDYSVQRDKIRLDRKRVERNGQEATTEDQTQRRPEKPVINKSPLRPRNVPNSPPSLQRPSRSRPEPDVQPHITAFPNIPTLSEIASLARPTNVAPTAMMTSLQSSNTIDPVSALKIASASPPKLHEESNKDSELPAAKSAHKPKAVSLWVITRTPRYLKERWLEGRFQGKTLATFTKEVEAEVRKKTHHGGAIDKLILTLSIGEEDMSVTLLRGAEDVWDETLSDFAAAMKAARAKNQPDSVTFRIMIEPVYAQDAASVANGQSIDDIIEF